MRVAWTNTDSAIHCEDTHCHDCYDGKTAEQGTCTSAMPRVYLSLCACKIIRQDIAESPRTYTDVHYCVLPSYMTKTPQARFTSNQEPSNVGVSVCVCLGKHHLWIMRLQLAVILTRNAHIIVPSSCFSFSPSHKCTALESKRTKEAV